MSLNQIIYQPAPVTECSKSKKLVCESINVVNNLVLEGELTASGTQGTEGQVLAIVAGEPAWATPFENPITLGAPNSILSTNSTATAAVFTNDIIPTTINVTGNATLQGSLTLDGTTGIENQAIINHSGKPEWDFVFPSYIPPGLANSILQSTGVQTVFSNNIAPDNVNVRQQLQFNANSGVDGQIVTKSGGVPVWGTVSVPSITPTTLPFGIVQENSAGTAFLVSNDIQVNDAKVNGQLIASNGTSGVAFNVFNKDGNNNTQWSQLGPSSFAASNLPFATLQQNSTGSAIVYSNDINVNAATINNSLTVSNGQGSPNQFLSKNGGNQLIWRTPTLPSNPGAPYTVLQTNPAGNAVLFDLIQPESLDPTGVPYGILQQNNLGNAVNYSTDITVNMANVNNTLNVNSQIALGASGIGNPGQIIAKVGGFPRWTTPPTPPTLGNPFDLYQVNSAGSAAEWTPTVSVTKLAPVVNNSIAYTNSSGTVLWSKTSNSMCAYSINPSQTIGEAAYSQIEFSTTIQEYADIVTRITPPVFQVNTSGLYKITVVINLNQQSVTNGQIGVNLSKNSITIFPNDYVSSEDNVNYSFAIRLIAGELLTIISRAVGASQTISGYASSSQLMFELLGN